MSEDEEEEEEKYSGSGQSKQIVGSSGASTQHQTQYLRK